jgi:hypothetical protein
MGVPTMTGNMAKLNLLIIKYWTHFFYFFDTSGIQLPVLSLELILMKPFAWQNILNYSKMNV